MPITPNTEKEIRALTPTKKRKYRQMVEKKSNLSAKINALSSAEKKLVAEMIKSVPKVASPRSPRRYRSNASMTNSTKRAISYAKKYRAGQASMTKCGPGEKISYRNSYGELRSKPVCIRRRQSSNLPKLYRKSVPIGQIEKFGSRCKNGYTRNYRTGRCSPSRR